MARAGDDGGGGAGFGSDFMVLRPDKSGIGDLFHLLWSCKVAENSAVDCPIGTVIAERRRRWALFVSLVAQMLLLWTKKPVALLGGATEYWMNLLNENGGSVFMLITNALQVNLHQHLQEKLTRTNTAVSYMIGSKTCSFITAS